MASGGAGGTDTFSVVLNTQPTVDVSMDLSSSNISEGLVSPASLTFTSANWNGGGRAMQGIHRCG